MFQRICLSAYGQSNFCQLLPVSDLLKKAGLLMRSSVRKACAAQVAVVVRTGPRRFNGPKDLMGPLGPFLRAV